MAIFIGFVAEAENIGGMESKRVSYHFTENNFALRKKLLAAAAIEVRAMLHHTDQVIPASEPIKPKRKSMHPEALSRMER
jgi:hypothetical protein